jgi:hypothetical protein
LPPPGIHYPEGPVSGAVSRASKIKLRRQKGKEKKRKNFRQICKGGVSGIKAPVRGLEALYDHTHELYICLIGLDAKGQ